jgi:hypothetical protein
MEDYMIEFLPKLGVKLNDDIKITIGMEFNEVNILLGEVDFERSLIRSFPDREEKKKRILYKKYQLFFDFKDNILETIEFSPDINVYFKDINLSNIEYKGTINSITAMGYEYNFREEAYEFNDINLCIYAPREELESISIYRENYFDDMYRILNDFTIEIRKENGIEKRVYIPIDKRINIIKK